MADRAVQRGWLRPGDIDLRRRRQPGRTGNGVLGQVADQLGDGAAAKSERLLHSILRRAGVPGWRANYRIWLGGELIAVVDVALVRQRIAIEVDGWAYHSDVDRFQRDRIRQNRLVNAGWTVLRFTWADLVERPEYVLNTVLRRIAGR